ncbi:MAG: hypothetical protein U9Q03_04655 [Patescibacteria group bacterium]|nr:hypothetical protein [Patescibacteria group bacterium]
MDTYMMCVTVMVALGIVGMVLGLVMLVRKERERVRQLKLSVESGISSDDTRDVPDGMEQASVSEPDEEQEMVHFLLWDPLRCEPQDEATAATVHMTVIDEDGKEVLVSFAVLPEIADRYLSRDGGPVAFKDAIMKMKGRPGMCLVAMSDETMRPMPMNDLFDIIVGPAGSDGNIDEWLDMLQAHWVEDTGYYEDTGARDTSPDPWPADEVTDRIDMRLVHEPLDRAEQSATGAVVIEVPHPFTLSD